MIQKLTARKVSLSVQTIANLMQISKEEILFFEHLAEIRQIISDYNFYRLSTDQIEEKLLAVKKQCKDPFYKEALDSLSSALIGR